MAQILKGVGGGGGGGGGRAAPQFASTMLA